MTTLAVFDTWVANELVFEAEAGGLETENASTRRGVVGSLVAKPCRLALRVGRALRDQRCLHHARGRRVARRADVAPDFFRLDATARHAVGTVRGKPVSARAGVGYTFLAGSHLTDAIIGPAHARAQRFARRALRLHRASIDGYNVLGLKYADDAEVYVSNWSSKPGQQPASLATHLTAAPPATVIGTIALYF